MKDDDTNVAAFVEAESGGKPFGDPVPPGSYSILERAGRDGFYRLERNDSNFGDDKTPEGRTNIRLHRPGRTIGCIAVCTDDGFASVKGILDKTATSRSKVDSKSLIGRLTGQKESLAKFGSLKVLPSGSSLRVDNKTGVVSVTRTQTGSRIREVTKICTMQKDGICK